MAELAQRLGDGDRAGDYLEQVISRAVQRDLPALRRRAEELALLG